MTLVAYQPPDVERSDYDDSPLVEHVGNRPLTLKRLLEGDPPPPPQMQADQWTLAADVNLIAGNGDAGKSTTLFHSAICTVLGRPVFGSLAVRRPGPVVMLVPQDGEAVARHNCDAQVVAMDLTPEERVTLVRDLYIVGDDRPYSLLTDTAAIGACVREVGAAMFMADPLSGVIGTADENDEAVAHAVCENLRRDVARPTGAAVMIAGHLRKPSRDSSGSAIADVFDFKGSVGWSNHARMVWTVSKPKGGDLITLRLVKSNRIQTGVEHQVKLMIDADPLNAAHWLSCRLVDANVGASSQSFTPGVGRALNGNEQKALAALDDRHEPGQRLSNSRWHAESGIASAETFRSVKDRLLDTGLAVAEPTGRMNPNGKTRVNVYGISERGRQTRNTGWTPEGVKL
jgi:AAA domain